MMSRMFHFLSFKFVSSLKLVLTNKLSTKHTFKNFTVSLQILTLNFHTLQQKNGIFVT